MLKLNNKCMKVLEANTMRIFGENEKYLFQYHKVLFTFEYVTEFSAM